MNKLKNTRSLILIFVFILGLFQASQSTNDYEYYMGGSLDLATLNDKDDQKAININPFYSNTHTLTAFQTIFSVDVGLTHVLVKIKTRGASQILVAYTQGGIESNIYTTSGNEVLNIDADSLDYTAAERVEDYHIIEKISTDTG